jgi:hypothetical protein
MIGPGTPSISAVIGTSARFSVTTNWQVIDYSAHVPALQEFLESAEDVYIEPCIIVSRNDNEVAVRATRQRTHWQPGAPPTPFVPSLMLRDLTRILDDPRFCKGTPERQFVNDVLHARWIDGVLPSGVSWDVDAECYRSRNRSRNGLIIKEYPEPDAWNHALELRTEESDRPIVRLAAVGKDEDPVAIRTLVRWLISGQPLPAWTGYPTGVLRSKR